jgi:hypothetical protein
MICCNGSEHCEPQDHQPAPKRFVAQELLRDLDSGADADDRLVAALITALCRSTFPQASQSGLAAIQTLKTSQAVERKERSRQAAMISSDAIDPARLVCFGSQRDPGGNK